MEKQEIYDALNEAYFSENCHEKQVLKNLGRLAISGGVFVDIGASLGQFTRYAARHLHQSRIVSVEADPVRYEELERNSREWSEESHTPIETVHAALTDEVGEVTFYTTNSNVSGGLYSHESPNEADWEPVTVSSVTLDSLFSEEPPDLIKVDIEGGEYKMLLGSTKILQKRHTIFLVELHSWPDEDGVNPAVESRRIFGENGYYRVPFFDKYLFMPFGVRLLRERLLWAARICKDKFKTSSESADSG